LFRRLLIAALLCIALSLACWLLLPRVGFDVPWWVPLVGFIVILAGSLAPLLDREGPDADQDEFLNDDPGPSPADLERFNAPDDRPAPHLKITRE